MIEQVKGWGLLIERYFLYLCNYIAFFVKRLGSLTATVSSSRDDHGRGDSSSIVLNKSLSSSHVQSSASDKKQNGCSKGRKLKPSSQIPGPKCMSVFGSFFEFNKFGPSRFHELATERHAQYGDIFREQVFSQEFIFVASTDMLKQWMLQEGKFPKSVKQDPSLLFSKCCPNLKRGLFFRDGEEWQRLRKIAHTIMHKNASDFESHGLYESFEEFIRGYMQDLQQVIGKSEDGLLYDLETKAYDFSVGGLLSIMFGSNANKFEQYTGSQVKTLGRNAKELNAHNARLLELPVRVAKWLGMSDWKNYFSKLHHNLTTSNKFCKLSREEIFKSPGSASLRTHGLLYKTINMTGDEQDIDDMLTDFAVDTKDPFAATIMFAMLVLGMHPEIQEKIYEEVSRIYPCNKPITYANAKNLEYTEGFLKEILRLYPVAAFAARVVTEETVIGEYSIKPGTFLVFSTFVAQRDPRYFTDPLKCLPERWINNNNNSDQICDTSAFTAFGLKGRLCVGQQLAISVLVLFLANLVRKFKLTSSELPKMVMRAVLYPDDQQPIKLEIR